MTNIGVARSNGRVYYWGPGYDQDKTLNQICPLVLTADSEEWTVDSSCRWADKSGISLFTADTTFVNVSATRITVDEGA
jgi:hypothetical protein